VKIVDDTTNYEKLALFYDQLMQGIDYEAWVSYVEELVAKFQGKVHSVADLACGTGNSTIPWAKRGYHTIGVDLSAEMLDIACRKAVRQGYGVKFQQCDLCCFRLDQMVDLAVCFQDGLNYILDINKLAAAFQSVFANLYEEGFFIFDLNYVPRLFPQSNEDSVEEPGEYSLAWSTRYDKQAQLWEIKITGKFKEDRGEWVDLEETHQEKVYDLEDVLSLLINSGFTLLGTYQAFTFSPPHTGTPRIVYIAQKTAPGK
jgi:ubiquinone/menaquinone biosynthesis C-methylase UbiE